MEPRKLETQDLSLVEALDRLLHKGIVLSGDAVITVADVDLIYLGLQVFVANVETATKYLPREEGEAIKSPEEEVVKW